MDRWSRARESGLKQLMGCSMSQNGIRATDLPVLAGLDHVMGNKDGTTGAIAMETLVALVSTRLGPAFETLADLEADLGWSAGALATVWGDGAATNNGVYEKLGVFDAGSWSRLGDLPLSTVSTGILNDKANRAEFVELLADFAALEAGLAADVSALEAGLAADVSALEARVASVSAGLVPAGEWDASSGSFPSGAAAQTFYFVSVAGAVDGVSFSVGDWLIALVAQPSISTFTANWTRAKYAEVIAGSAGTAQKPPTQTILSTGAVQTYTPPLGCTALYVKMVGAGGGGRGQPAGETFTHRVPGGGSGGGLWRFISAVAESYTYTVGSGGLGGYSMNGTPGGNTTFSGLGVSLVANGGEGGGGDYTGTAGAATGGDVNVPGERSFASLVLGTIKAGGSIFGPSDSYSADPSGGILETTDATVPGTGGAGCPNGTDTFVSRGGDGADGLIIITEFY